MGALGGLTILSTVGTAQAQQRSILNTGFEAQNPNGPGAPSFQLFNSGAVTGWRAVANSNNTATQIELWDSGFQGVTSYEGVVHAEMNANVPGALYQEVCFTTGESIGWFFAHRARAGGANPQIANFEIANASGTVLQTLASQSSPIDNTWRTNSGTAVYTGATGIQRIQFRTSNPGSVGNFLDAIQIDLAAYAEFSSATTSALEGAVGPTVPSIAVTGKVDQAVTIPLTITGGTATSGVDYTLTPLSITIPAGNYNGTLFPIPLTIVNDSAIEADETVIVRLGTPSNSEIFLANTGCSGNPTLQATHTILNDDVDLRTNKTLSSTNASPAEGDAVSFQIAVTNLGARAATSVTLTDQLPAGMTFTGATASAGSYNSGNGVWTVGNLAAGATATLTLTGTVNAGQAGATLTNTTTAATGANVDASRTAGDDLVESVVVNATSGLAVSKSGVLNRGPDNIAGVGDVITYSFTVRNTGTTTLTNVTLTERLPGAILTGGPIATLPRGATNTTTFTATYTLTQADIDRGRVDNIVDGTARNGAGATLTATGQTTTPIPQTAGLGVTKTQTGGPTTVTAAGQTLTYSVVMRNTGNITQTNARVVDTLPSASSSTLTGQTESILADGLLQPGETWTYTVTYVTSQADVDGGAPLVNSALASSDQSSPVSATATTLVSRTPLLAVDKEVDRTAIGQPGVLNYTITLRNAGNVTLTGISVADTLPNGAAGVLSGPTGDDGVAGAIDVGETWTYTTTYSVTQAEIEAGAARVNTVTARTAQINSPLTDTATTTITRNPAVAIDKTVDRASISAPGVLNYTVRVSNTGNLALTGVAVSDTLPNGAVGALTGPTGDAGVVGTLDVGETWTYTTTFNVTQAQIDAGTTLVNTARVTTTQTPTAVTDTAATTIAASPGLTVRKTVDRPTISAPGVLNYTITVANTGNVSLTGVAATDTLPNGSAGSLTGPSGDAGVLGTLDVGETWTYTTTYAVAQAEIDAGTDRTNTAGVVTTQTPTPATSSAVTRIQRSPAITIDKTVDRASISAPGPLNYTVTVRNTGNVALTGVAASDTLPDGTAGSLTGPAGDGGAPGVLDLGETWTYTTTYAVAQAEIDAGTTLVNTARVTTTQTPTAVTDTAATTIAASPGLTVRKTVDRPTISAPGVLSYTITVANTGNVSLTGVTPTDTLPNGSAGSLTGPTGDAGVLGTLDVGETWTYTTTYAVAQAEIDAGTDRTNTVGVVTTQTPTPATSSAVTRIQRSPAITIDKTVNVASLSSPVTLVYTIVVRNTGNVALTGVNVTDTLPDGSPGVLSPPSGDGGVIGVLDVGEAWTYATSFNGDQARIDAGVTLTNQASVTTTQTPTPATDTAVTTIVASPALTVRKTVDRSTISAPGVLNYTITVVNTGNVSLTGVTPTDTLPDGSAGSLTGPTGDGGAAGVIEPGETWTYATTYGVTQAEIDAGTDRTNTVSVVTTQTPTPTTSSAVTRIQRAPAMVVDKTVDRASISAPGPLNYTVTVRNTGNVALTGVTPTDTLPDGSAGSLSGPAGDGGAAGVLDVGETWTYTTTFNVTQAQIDAGTNLTNLASVVSAQTPTPVTDTAVTAVSQRGAFRIDKSVDLAVISAPGVLNYTIRVINTGNVSLTGVTPVDTLPDGSTAVLSGPTGDGGVAGVIDVGETWTYTTTYSVSQARIEAGGTLINAVSVTTDQTTAPQDDAATSIARYYSLSIDKVVDQSSTSTVGTVLNYVVTLRNTGNVSLTGLNVTDTLPSGAPGVLTFTGGDTDGDNQLDVAEQWTYSGTYTVTQADIDNGATLVNTARGTSIETPAPVSDTATTIVNQTAGILVEKDVDKDTIAVAGTLTYIIRATNIGNTTLSNVSPVDTLPDGSIATLVGPSGDGGVPGQIDVGETWTWTTTYTVSQNQLNAGADLINNVTVTATDPGGNRTDSDSVTTTLVRVPGLAVTKSVDRPAISAPGTLNYTLTLSNTGNVSLTGVAPTDTLPDGATAVLAGPTGDGGTLGVLDVDETWTYTTTFAVDQARIDAGTALVNTLSATTTQTPTPETASATTTITSAPSLRVTKVVDRSAISAPGPLNYTITVVNTGNVSLTGVTPTDTLPDGTAGVLSAPAGDGGAPGVLDVGETWTYTAVFNAAQAQIDAGATLTNSVSVVSTQTPAPVTATAATTVSSAPGLAVTKTVDQTSVSAPGTLNYTLTLSNTGNVSLTGVAPTDTLPDGSTATLVGPTGDGGVAGVIDVGETWTYTTTFAVDQARIDAGTALVNTLSATTTQTPTPETASATTTITSAPSLRVTKVVDRSAISAPGPLNYTITVANTGNVSLTGVTPTDTLPDGTAGSLAGPTGDAGAPGVLDVGETWTYTAVFNAAQAQIDAGATLTNSVSVVSTQTPAPVTATAATTVSGAPGLAVTKTVDQTSVSAPGVLNYTLTLSNTGNVSLTGVTPTDTLPDGTTATLVGPTGDGGTAGVLDVGETWTYTTTFAVDQSRVDAGATLVNNLSVVTAQTPTPETASAATTVAGAPGLQVTKVVDRGAISAPGPLNYTITVANTGNVSLTGVTPTDTLPDGTAGVLSAPAGDGGVAGVLDVGETWTYTAVFNVAQAQIDAGTTLTNSVSVVSAQTPVPATATAVTTVSGAPGLAVTKTVDQTSVSAPGTLNYTLTLSNTGNVSLTGVTPVDTLPDGSAGSLSGPAGDAGAPGVLDVGETWTYTTTVAVDQARIDAGTALVNTLSATTAQTPTAQTASATTTVAAAPDLTVTKTVDRTAISAPGVLNYVIRLRNAGNVSLTGVAPVDTLPDGTPATLAGPTGDGGTPGVLDVGETWTYTTTFAVDQARIDAGTALVNTLSAVTAQTPTARTATATTTVSSAPAVLITKTVDHATVSSPTTLTYTIRAQNAGNRSLGSVALNDTLSNGGVVAVGAPQESLPGGTTGVLDVGETWTWTATYALTQADIDAAATLVNTASVTTNLTATQTAAASTMVSDLSELIVEKDVDLQQVSAPGVLTYTIRVTNGGNTRLMTPVLTDTLSNGGAVIVGSPSESLPGGTAGVLDVGETWTYAATHAVTAAEIDAGADLVNTAAATAQRPAGGALAADDTALTRITQRVDLELVKTGVLNLGPDGRIGAGDVISFAFAVSNTGNVTINNLTLTDGLPGVVVAGGPIASLAAGATDTTTFTATYAITQADIDGGRITNPATATGTTSGGATATASDDVTLALTGLPTLTLDKTGSLNMGPDGRADVGDLVTYAFVVTNIGNVTVNSITISDVLPGIVLSGGPIATLAPGASDTGSITATYALTQADIDAGRVINTATANGQDPSGNPVSASDGLTTPIAGTPTLTLDKTGAINLGADGRADVGDLITYAFTVANTGNQTLTNVGITDALAGVTMSGGPIAALAPGASDTSSITATYALTQADIDAGRVINTATASAAAPGGGTVSATDSLTLPVTGAPLLTLDKTGVLDLGGDGRAGVGDVITYAFTVANTGNVTLSNLVIADALAGVTVSGGPIATLAPGASDASSITATYVLTQADVDAGRVINTATVTGQTPSGDPLTGTDSVTIAVAAAPALALTKTAALDDGGDGRADAGDTIRYGFLVANTGNQTLTNVVIADALAGVTVSGGPIASLAPGASDATTITATYILTQADIDAGRVVNTATATGQGPGAVSVSDADTVTTPILGAPAIVATKSAALTTDRATQGVGNAGDVITYTVTVANTGNTTVENLVVGDTYEGGAETLLTCAPTTLAPGATANCAAYTHVITQAEANAGEPLDNVVSARAHVLGRPAVSATAGSAATITVEPDPTDLQITKSAAPRDVKIGDLVRYTVTIVNVGAVDAVDVTMTDTPPPGFTYVDGSLAVDDVDDAFRLAGVSPIRVDQIDIPIGQRATVVYLLRVGAGVRPGSHVNSVVAEDGARRSNIATAEVRLTSDPLLDESLVVGTVFDDRDGDGWQDDGEPGIPGVRIASVEGLIVETDQFGRYHLVGVDGGPWERGRNFILKVDPVTLPPGSRFSTDNPLLRRVTPGLPVRFDFGVVLPQAAAPAGQEARP